jgi:hypothetical protein
MDDGGLIVNSPASVDTVPAQAQAKGSASRATWTDLKEQPLNSDTLRELLDNRIGAIRIPGFASPEECRAFAAAARQGKVKAYSVGRRIGYIGMAQYEYRWNHPKQDFFTAVPSALEDLRQVLDASFDPVARLMGLLQGVWPSRVEIAREEMGEYFAGIIRFASEGVDLHADWAPLNAPGYAIGSIDGQLGWNFFAEELAEGGLTTVHNAPWNPDVKPGQIPPSYGLDRSVVAGAPSITYRPTAGDVVLFNTRNPHEISGGPPGQGDRISIGSFVGRMPDNRLVLWS